MSFSVHDFVAQIIVIVCALVLGSLYLFQRFMAEPVVHNGNDGWMYMNLTPTAAPTPSSWKLLEDLLLFGFIVWVLTPIAEFIWALCQAVYIRGSAYASEDRQTVEYGACSRRSTQKSQSPFPASHVQEPMLAWQLLHPKGTALNEGWCVWLEGMNMSMEALRSAIRNVVQRHEVMRMKYTLVQDQAWTQEVLPVELVFPHIFSQVNTLNDAPSALLLAEEALNSPLKVFDGFGARIGVAVVSASKVLLYVVQHHVATDGVSMPLFYEDLKTQYRIVTLPLGSVVVSPPQPLACKDFAEKQLKNSKKDNEETLELWRQHICGNSGQEVARLDLPSDYIRKPQPSFKCVEVPLRITASLSEKIHRLAQSQEVTVFDILLSLHSTWLCLMSRQEDVIVWTSHHGRGESTFPEGMLGCFRKEMPLRLTPKGPFKDLLQVAAQAKKDGLSRGDVPSMQLYALGGWDGQGGQNVLNYYSDRYNKPAIASSAARSQFAPDVQATPVELRKLSAIPDVELNLSKDASSGCLCGYAVFSSDLFSLASAERMAEHFSVMAEAALCDASCDIWKLPLSTPNEEMALEAFHGPGVESQPTVVELLARCMRTAPGRIAVEYEASGEKLTYAEFGARVHGLAAHLKTLGVGRDILCALMLERSVEMIVGIHGVWAAGGAYVPIDPSAPGAYLDIIVEDLRVHNGSILANTGSCPLTLLTQSWVSRERQGLQHFSHVVCLDTCKPRLPGDPYHACEMPCGKDLCYSLYTSGSTGRPKGVLCQHQGLANYIEECRKKQGIVGEDVVMQKTPYIFDVSLYEFAVPLTVASKLLVAKHEGHKDVSYVIDTMLRCGVTVARFVPSYLDIFLEQIKLADAGVVPMALRAVGCSGEALHTPTCKSFLQLLPEADLFDLYGPTEATVDVTLLPCTGKALRAGKSIGQPLGGCQIYVATTIENAGRGERLDRTPVGLHGELLIGGVQVARGYLNLPERTAQAFVPNPFQQKSQDILYRTGDLVKWRADGHIVYIGRADRQVKLFGQRIELGEIESAVAKVEGVREAVAKMHKDSAGGPARLVIYVAPSKAATAEVMKRCRETLPQQMVPSAVVGIDEWPRTGSGKIDQKQLPSPPVVGVGGADGAEEEEEEASFALLAAKIQAVGLIGAMGDEEVQQQGWNSFQVMSLHAEMLRNPDKYIGNEGGDSERASTTATTMNTVTASEADRMQAGVISSVGHMWLLLMVLVLLEWLVAYWEWYRAVDSANGFHLNEFPILRRMNSLGRFAGDPIFTLLSGIQDMTDVQGGNTGALVRRLVLFMTIVLAGTGLDRILLQGPYVRMGWINASWALDTTRMCGVLNGASFIFARAIFMPCAIFLSMGRSTWIRFGGIVEWPWACLVFSLLVPAVVRGVPRVSGFGDGTMVSYVSACADFICELSPYYFLYPVFVGGIRFPRGIVGMKVRGSASQCLAITLAAAVVFMSIWRYTGIETTSDVDGLHKTWSVFLQRAKGDGSWPLMNAIEKNFDLYHAGLVAIYTLSLAAMMPVTPGPFSLLGTRVIACYLTMPLTLIAAGHFIGPTLVHMPEPWRGVLVPIGIFAVLLLCVAATTAQNLIPEWLLKWVGQAGSADSEEEKQPLVSKPK